MNGADLKYQEVLKNMNRQNSIEILAAIIIAVIFIFGGYYFLIKRPSSNTSSNKNKIVTDSNNLISTMTTNGFTKYESNLLSIDVPIDFILQDTKNIEGLSLFTKFSSSKTDNSGSHDSRIYVDTNGPFEIKALTNNDDCLRYGKNFENIDPSYKFQTTPVSSNLKSYNTEYNECVIKYEQKIPDGGFNIFERHVYLPAKINSNRYKQFEVYFYYNKNVAIPQDILNMRKSMTSFKIK